MSLGDITLTDPIINRTIEKIAQKFEDQGYYLEDGTIEFIETELFKMLRKAKQDCSHSVMNSRVNQTPRDIGQLKVMKMLLAQDVIRTVIN